MAKMEHFALFTDDLVGLKDFYVDAMGLRVILDNSAAPTPGFFLMDDAGTSLEIIGRPAGTTVGDTRFLCHVAFLVDDVATDQKRLEGLGCAFESDTVVDTPTMKTVFFRDPSGNRCQIVWRSKPLGS